ncbi:hypothetical protein Bhyg_07745, partial [Pseudolycoriella hygida]
NAEFLRNLNDVLNETDSDPLHVPKLILNTVSRIKMIQERCNAAESRKIFLNRAIEKGIILQKDPNVQAIVNEMLRNRFVDKKGVITFEHEMYESKMKLEMNSLSKEMTALNCIASKHRRLLKSITNEATIKLALVEKGNRTESAGKWAKFTSSIEHINGIYPIEDFTKMDQLKVSGMEHMEIEPTDGFESELDIHEVKLSENEDEFVPGKLTINNLEGNENVGKTYEKIVDGIKKFSDNNRVGGNDNTMNSYSRKPHVGEKIGETEFSPVNQDYIWEKDGIIFFPTNSNTDIPIRVNDHIIDHRMSKINAEIINPTVLPITPELPSKNIHSYEYVLIEGETDTDDDPLNGLKTLESPPEIIEKLSTEKNCEGVIEFNLDDKDKRKTDEAQGTRVEDLHALYFRENLSDTSIASQNLQKNSVHSKTTPQPHIFKNCSVRLNNSSIEHFQNEPMIVSDTMKRNNAEEAKESQITSEEYAITLQNYAKFDLKAKEALKEQKIASINAWLQGSQAQEDDDMIQILSDANLATFADIENEAFQLAQYIEYNEHTNFASNDIDDTSPSNLVDDTVSSTYAMTQSLNSKPIYACDRIGDMNSSNATDSTCHSYLHKLIPANQPNVLQRLYNSTTQAITTASNFQSANVMPGETNKRASQGCNIEPLTKRTTEETTQQNIVQSHSCTTDWKYDNYSTDLDYEPYEDEDEDSDILNHVHENMTTQFSSEPINNGRVKLTNNSSESRVVTNVSMWKKLNLKRKPGTSDKSTLSLQDSPLESINPSNTLSLVSQVFNRPCINYLNEQNCEIGCIFNHQLPSDQLNNKVFFVKYFPCVCRVFVEKKMESTLLSAVKHCENLDTVHYFKNIYQSFINIGWTKRKALCGVVNSSCKSTTVCTVILDIITDTSPLYFMQILKKYYLHANILDHHMIKMFHHTRKHPVRFLQKIFIDMLDKYSLSSDFSVETLKFLLCETERFVVSNNNFIKRLNHISLRVA